MINPQLAGLAAYPFDRLRSLLDPVAPPPDLAPIVLSVGEPRHSPPPQVAAILAREAALWGRYPPIDGTPAFREAVAGWLIRRYGLSPALIGTGDDHILPVAGTREALYLIAALALPRRRGSGAPLVLMPNPFYQVYQGAAVMHGGQAVYLEAPRSAGFFPALETLGEATLTRTALMYLCSPANPQGAVADLAYLRRAVRLARDHDFVLVVDECYADVFDRDPPPGALRAAASLDGSLDNVIVFHSLSKRSSVPGLRSGFVAGDPKLIAAFRRLRSFGGASVGLPILAASAFLWGDDGHVEENRRLYCAKLNLAESLIGARFGFYRPAGGFFLWLEVGDGERAALDLWRRAAVRVLPGAYLAHTDDAGDNPGAAYIRLALVDSLATTEDALRRLLNVL